MKLSIYTGEFESLGRQTAQTMWMFNENTAEHQEAIKIFKKYEDQVLNPKSKIQFECAKAFITAGDQFIKEMKKLEK